MITRANKLDEKLLTVGNVGLFPEKCWCQHSEEYGADGRMVISADGSGLGGVVTFTKEDISGAHARRNSLGSCDFELPLRHYAQF